MGSDPDKTGVFHKPYDIGMSDESAFGFAGAAGSVDEVSQISSANLEIRNSNIEIAGLETRFKI